MTFDELLDRLAGRAFDHITEHLGARTGIFFCPLDRIPMIRLPSGFYYCPTCEGKFSREAPRRSGVGDPSPEADAFRPFDPFRGARGANTRRRRGDGVPPRAGRPGGNPNRQRVPPPRQPRNIHSDPIAEAYKELELSPPVTVDDVKKRRRELALQHHPDRNGGDGKKLARVNAAADLLLQVL